MKTSIIRPGLLVALSSTVSGGVSYSRVDLASETQDGGEALSKWETTRIIEDPAEHDRAVKARSKALSAIRAICSPTRFGLLCPIDKERDLDEAVQKARAIVEAHNATATYTRVDLASFKGRIASTDEEAARAIGEEVQRLLAAMNAGIDKLDPDAIKDAANRARDVAKMLGDEQIATVTSAIEQARKAARQIVKRVQKDGEAAAIVLKDLQRGAIEKARIAFLDLDLPEAVASGPELPAVDVQRMGDLDLGEAPPEGTHSAQAVA